MRKTAIMFLLLATSCTLAPEYTRPDIATPAWRGSEPRTELPNQDWWNQFGSAELNNIISKALESNNDLRAALQRIAQARASARVTESALYPSISASASANRNYNDLIHGDYTKSNSYSTGLNASYTLDLFARNYSSSESSWLAAESSAYDREALALTVQSQTAQVFLGYLALNDRVAVAENNLKLTEDVLRITQERFRVGTLSALELAQQKTAYAQSKSSLASLRQSREVQLNQLAVLLGKPPQDFSVTTTPLKQIHLPDIAPVQPATLIARRPDIQSAEARLKAANYDIGAARAAFFPTLSLSASSVLTASPSGTPTALTASLLQPLFRAGALQAGVEVSEARKAELQESYTKTVLTAFQDVQNALAAQTAAAERVAQFTEAAGQAEQAYSIARQRFNVGSIDFLTLLDTQRSQLSAQDALIAARLEQLTASIALFTAVGGAARAGEGTPPEAQTTP